MWRALTFAFGLAGCDQVLGLVEISPPIDGKATDATDLGCAMKTALLCADFEEGNMFYANQLFSELTIPMGNAMAEVGARSTDDHAFYVQTSGDTYRVDAQSSNVTSRITATFEIELTSLDATSKPEGLVVLYADQAVAECYVALNFEPPMRLALAVKCGTTNQSDLTLSLPSPAAFVPVTLDMDLIDGSASATLGLTTVTLPILPDSKTERPGVAFGFIDATGGATDQVAFDNLVVVVAP